MQSPTYRSLAASLCVEEWKHSLRFSTRNQQQLFSSHRSANHHHFIPFWDSCYSYCSHLPVLPFLLQTYKRHKLQGPFDHIFAQRKIKRSGIVDFWLHGTFRFNSTYLQGTTENFFRLEFDSDDVRIYYLKRGINMIINTLFKNFIKFQISRHVVMSYSIREIHPSVIEKKKKSEMF